LLRLRTAQYVIAREYTPLYDLIVRLKTTRIWYVTTLIKTEYDSLKNMNSTFEFTLK